VKATEDKVSLEDAYGWGRLLGGISDVNSRLLEIRRFEYLLNQDDRHCLQEAAEILERLEVRAFRTASSRDKLKESSLESPTLRRWSGE
jgi:hypothetical protein